MTNLRQIVQNDLPKLGGSWITAFFLVGLLIGFRNPSLNRLRFFILMCLPVLIIVKRWATRIFPRTHPKSILKICS
jgi:hypothetical protein